MDHQSSRNKRRNKRTGNQNKKTAPTVPVDNEEDMNGYNSDGCESVSSIASSVGSQMFEENNEDEFDYQEDFESKLIDNIEGARQKNSKSRQLCLTEIKKALCRRYVNEFIMGREETILDFVEKLLKKGQKEDRILSSAISCALCIQLGDGDSNKAFTVLKPVLISLIGDDSVSPTARASAASALGLCCFIGTEELEHTVECLNALKSVFSKKVPAEAARHCAFSSALLAWGLLLTIATPSILEEQISNCVAILVKLLEGGDLSLRIAAGEASALVYELARFNHVSLQGSINVLHSYLRDYANESGKHKGKKEKKQQKASFRDFLKTVEHGQNPDETMKFGLEFIQMTSWTWLRRYSAFKEALGSGINIHLETNMLLRDIFDLGLPVARELKESKVSKYERQLMNAAMSKTRTQKRNQRRDNKKSTNII